MAAGLVRQGQEGMRISVVVVVIDLLDGVEGEANGDEIKQKLIDVCCLYFIV